MPSVENIPLCRLTALHRNFTNRPRCKGVVTDERKAKLSFTFYTHPKTDVIFKRGFFKNLFAGRSAESEFLKLQKIIVEAGYTSFDLS